MEYDSIYQLGYGSQRIWDHTEDAWRVYNAADLSDYGLGWFESIFVPANTTVVARAQIKLAPNYSGNYPRFEYRDVISGVGPNRLQNSGGNFSSWVVGGASSVQFTAAASSDYEIKDLTIASVYYPRYISIGVHVDSSNTSEGYWMKDIIVKLDKPYSVSRFNSINSGPGNQVLVGIGTSLQEKILRLGGRLQ
jgi:hypothetical protein